MRSAGIRPSSRCAAGWLSAGVRVKPLKASHERTVTARAAAPTLVRGPAHLELARRLVLCDLVVHGHRRALRVVQRRRHHDLTLVEVRLTDGEGSEGTPALFRLELTFADASLLVAAEHR